MYLLAKASTFLPEWELRTGIADCLEVPGARTKDLARQLSKFPDPMLLWTGRRHPVILILDEVLLVLLGNTFHLREAKESWQFSHFIRKVRNDSLYMYTPFFWTDGYSVGRGRNDIGVGTTICFCCSGWQGHELFFRIQNTPGDHGPP
jgi:hypothetical protein